MTINSANFHRSSRSHAPANVSGRKDNNELPAESSGSNQSESVALDTNQPTLAAAPGLAQQLASLVTLIMSLLETMGYSGANANGASSAGAFKVDSSRQGVKNPSGAEIEGEGDNTPVTNSSVGVSNSKSGLPAVNPNDWSTRDGKNGEEFATPFVSKNIIKSGGSITSQLKGNEGSEATLNKKIGTGFYQFNVNPQLSSQVGDIPTVFFYSGKGSDGGNYEGGFELDAEYNMVEQGTVTFGTWIDGKKYNQVTVPAPKGDQTIGFNIQNGVSQIGFVNADGTFEPVSETRDKRITPQLASNLQAMTNSWRSKSTGGSDNGEVSSITINGMGRSDAPGQPVEAL